MVPTLLHADHKEVIRGRGGYLFYDNSTDMVWRVHYNVTELHFLDFAAFSYNLKEG
jgi:hypothetical protein